MATVFLSYSHKDHHFAELADTKLSAADIHIWRELGQLRAGSEWRSGIERAIAESIAVLVALSQSSAASSYVTYEWAYGLGMGKTIVPLILESCKVHQRLEPIQSLDFSVPGSLPWAELIKRIREIESDATSQADPAIAKAIREPPQENPTVRAILGFLDKRGYQIASYERLRKHIKPPLTDQELDELVKGNPRIFRDATVVGGKPGLAKRVP
jgi:TIR domain